MTMIDDYPSWLIKEVRKKKECYYMIILYVCGIYLYVF